MSQVGLFLRRGNRPPFRFPLIYVNVNRQPAANASSSSQHAGAGGPDHPPDHRAGMHLGPRHLQYLAHGQEVPPDESSFHGIDDTSADLYLPHGAGHDDGARSPFPVLRSARVFSLMFPV